MPPLERFILHRLWELDGQVRAAYEGYLFQDVIRPLTEFCQNDLSALFFDIRRDALYCDRPDSLRRRAVRTVMDAVFERLTAWLAPLIPFTMEEAWATRFPDAGSNCLRVIPETPADWRNDAEAARWAKVAGGDLAWSPARWRSSGARSASARALEAAPRGPHRRPGPDGRLRRPRRRRGVPHQPGDAWSPATGPADAFRLAEVARRRGRAAARRGPQVRPLAGASCRRWAPTRATPTSPCATPTRWPPGTQRHGEERRMTGVTELGWTAYGLAAVVVVARPGGEGLDPRRPAPAARASVAVLGPAAPDRGLEPRRQLRLPAGAQRPGPLAAGRRSPPSSSSWPGGLGARGRAAAVRRWRVGLVIGGAVGNVIDRIRFGAVVDFIDVTAAATSRGCSTSPIAPSPSASACCCSTCCGRTAASARPACRQRCGLMRRWRGRRVLRYPLVRRGRGRP